MDEDIDVEFEFDEDMNGIAVIRCPQCGIVSRTPMNSLADGSTIDCSCGLVIRSEGEAFAAMQRDFTDFKRLIDDL